METSRHVSLCLCRNRECAVYYYIMKRFQGIIFDFDGTLVSLEIDFSSIRSHLEEMRQEYGIVSPEKTMPILEGLVWTQQKNAGNDRLEEYLSEAKRYLERCELLAAKQAKLFPGVKELLDEIAAKGVMIGIISRNCEKAVGGLIEQYQLACHHLLTRDHVARVKPDPFHVEAMRTTLGLSKETVLVVGDHPFDIRPCKILGISSCGVLSSGTKKEDLLEAGADYLFPDVTGVASFFGIARFSSLSFQ
ncbi:MAG: HAD family hydrolase [Candidatus Ratteibacteria bacterium]